MQLDLKHLLRIASRWWWLLVLAPMLGGVAAFTVSNRMPDMYSAETTLLINSGSNGGNLYTSIQAGQNLTQTYSLWVVSRPVLEAAAAELNYEGGADRLAEHVSSSSVDKTLFIHITATDTNPDTAAHIANTIADRFLVLVQEQSQTQNAQVKSNIDAQIVYTTQQIQDLNYEIEELRARQLTLSTEERVQLDTLTGERSQLQQDLSQLQTTARSIDVELASAQTRITISSPAVAPPAPYAPNTARATVLGVFAGLTLGIAVAVLLEYFDNTIRSRHEITQLTKSPVLAAVANAPDIHRGGQQLFVLGSPQSGPAESMRLLRANLEFASASESIKSLVVSSPGPDEGKSTLTANLGVVMAQAGLRTVIIDADLRRPTQHSIFGVNNTQGLSTLLMRPDECWTTAAVPLNIPRLTLIPSGPLPPNPSDLLSLDRLGFLIEEIGESADIILIDTSPVLAVSDALVVAARSDSVLLVCRTGHTRRDALRNAVGAFEQAAVRVTGLVLNRDKNEVDAYGRYDQTLPGSLERNRRFYYGTGGSDIPALRTLHSSSNGNGKWPVRTLNDRPVKAHEG